MAVKLKTYTQLKEQVDAAQRRADKAQGEYDANMKRLKKEFSCSTLAEAKKKHKQLEKQEAGLTEKLESAIEDYQEKWKEENE